MKKIIHLTVFLALIAGLAGAALGFANNMTAPVIAANDLKAEEETLRVIYPDGEFEIVDQGVSDTIEKIFRVDGKNYIFKMKVSGYKDGTSFLVALNDDGTIYDYVAISNGDTNGIGSKVTEDDFRNTLKGADATSDELLDDTIAGATVSSKPILEGIKEAADYQADSLK